MSSFQFPFSCHFRVPVILLTWKNQIRFFVFLLFVQVMNTQWSSRTTRHWKLRLSWKRKKKELKHSHMAHFIWQFHSHKMKICLGGAWIIKVIRGLLILYSFPLSVLSSRFYISSAQRAVWSGSGRFSFAVTPPVRLSRSQQSQWANSTWALSVKALHNTFYICSQWLRAQCSPA